MSVNLLLKSTEFLHWNKMTEGNRVCKITSNMNNVKLITVFSLFLPIQGHTGIKRSSSKPAKECN